MSEPAMRAAIVPVLVILLVSSCSSGYSEEKTTEKLRVRRATFVSELVLTGELEAARGAAITVPDLPNWETSIKWLANDGSDINEGERVAELDNSTFTNDLDSRRQSELQVRQELQQRESEWKADLEQKQLEFEKRRSEMEKAKISATVPREIVSGRDFEERQITLQRATVEYEKARDLLTAQKKGVSSDRDNLLLRLRKAQRDVTIAEQAIQALVLRAPRAGIVVLRDLPWERRKLQAGDTVFVGLPIAIIPELASLRVSVALPDVDDGRIDIGIPATITLDGYPEMQFSGTVSSISAVAQESSRQSLRRAFKVYVTLDRIDASRMRPGLSARVALRRATLPNALLAPRSALDLSGSRALLASGRRVAVKLGACNAQECVVTRGLDEGQRLAPIGEAPRG